LAAARVDFKHHAREPAGCSVRVGRDIMPDRENGGTEGLISQPRVFEAERVGARDGGGEGGQ
jgi:hypothetical protein